MCAIPHGRFIILFYFFIATGYSKVYAQSITPLTLNNGGGSVAGLEWNLGESVSIAYFSSPSYFLNTGVLQPMSNVVTAINEFGPAVFGNQITIGPIPTNNLLHFKANFIQAGNLSIQVLDVKSSLVLTHESGAIVSHYEKDFFMEAYPSGIYYMKVFFKPIYGLAKMGIYKIIKL